MAFTGPRVMRMLPRATISSTLLLIISASGYGQGADKPRWKSEIAKGYLPYHRLVAADFPINDKIHSENGMYTTAFFHSTCRDRCVVQDGRATDRVTQWICWWGFDRNKSSRKSWFKFVNETLPHEQGHLDIAELHHRSFARTLTSKFPVGKGATADEAHADLVKRTEEMTDDMEAQLTREQLRYDTETAHGENMSKQHEWTAAIQAQLRAAGIHF